MKKIISMLLIASFVAFGSVYAREGTPKDPKPTTAVKDSSKTKHKKVMKAHEKKMTTAKSDSAKKHEMKAKKAKAEKAEPKEN